MDERTGLSGFFISADVKPDHAGTIVAKFPIVRASAAAGLGAVSVNAPNILWIVTTQWRAQACGYAGDPNARTPHLDRLAAEAVNFTQTVTPHPFGPFARAGLLTGRASPENGVRDYFDPLPRAAETIAHVLRRHGYATAFFGKWHLGARDRTAPLVGEAHAKTIVPPEARGGFELWEGFESGFLLNDPWLHGTRLGEPRKFEGYQSDVVCQRAAEWITGDDRTRDERAEHARAGSDASSPWFAVVSLEAPHPPYTAAAAGIVPRDAAEIVLPATVPRGGETEARARRELAGYYAHIEATDRAIGDRLLARVDDNTIVVFTSTHGDMHGAHGLFRKGWPHEESVRVPLLVRLPRSERATAPGVGANSALVSLLDLPRWTAAWASGANVIDPLRSSPGAQRISMPSVVTLPHQCDRIWSGWRTVRRKLVLNADGSPWLFFDLEVDPGETTNLVHEASRREELQRWLDKFRRSEAAAAMGAGAFSR